MNGRKITSLALLFALILSFAVFANAENVKTTYEVMVIMTGKYAHQVPLVWAE